MAAASGLCSPTSSNTAVVNLAKAASPRRVRAFRIEPAICGVLARLKVVPSSATRRQPRQNASRCRRAACGRSTRRIRSAKISHGNRARRSAHELSVSASANNVAECSANVPAPCITWYVSAGISSASGTRGLRPRRRGITGDHRAPTSRSQAARNPTRGDD
jgi:hypothetical protein